MRRLWLFVVFMLMVVAQGCSSLDDGPAPFASDAFTEKGRADVGAFLSSCGVTEADVAAVKLDADVPTMPLETATTQMVFLREASAAADAKLQQHLARVAPALEDEKVKHLATVFEQQAKVVVKIYRDDHYFDDVELAVSDVRSKYLASVKKLAAMLDAIGSSRSRASSFARYPQLTHAYVELASSPCPARSVRFATILLSLDDNPDSPYAAAKSSTSNDYAALMLQTGLARALVERAVEHTGGGPGDDPPAKALAEVRDYVGRISGISETALSFLADRENARAKALDPAFEVKIKGHDLTPAFRAVNAVLFWWNVSDAAAAQDVESLLKQSPTIANSAAKGVAALAGHFEATRIAGGATKVAEAAATIGRYMGFVFAAQGIIDTLDRLDDPGSNTGRLVAELVGQCMLLASSFMPPPLNFVVSGIGQITVWVASFIGDPPPDELAPLMDRMVTDGQITEAEKVAILEAHPGNIWSLGRSLRLEPTEVRWFLTTARLMDGENLSQRDGLYGSPYMGLYRVHLETGLAGDAMASWLRSIGRSPGAEGRLELHMFLLYTAADALYDGRSVRQAITARRDALDEYDVKFEAQDVGLSASRALTLVRAAYGRAIAGLPIGNCPAESAARCSGDGRFVVWCANGSLLRTADCWNDDRTCSVGEAEKRATCVER